eukprot:763380-Hanusia_phi.AAC.2
MSTTQKRTKWSKKVVVDARCIAQTVADEYSEEMSDGNDSISRCESFCSARAIHSLRQPPSSLTDATASTTCCRYP